MMIARPYLVRLLSVSSLAAGTWLVLASAPLHSQSERPGGQPTVFVEGHEAVAGEVLVQFTDSPSAAVHRDVEQLVDALENVAVGRSGLRRIRSRSLDVQALVAMFQGRSGVAFAEPNYILRAADVPNDPQFPTLWGLRNTGQTILGVPGIAGADISAVEAWEVSTGSRSNVVAVIDSGINYLHSDLAANIWSAPTAFTITVGGVSLACPANSHGYNAILHTCDPMDDNGHGTHVAGTIGAVGNNGIGVAGVNWTASIIGGKFLNSAGNGTTADAIDTIDFMIQVKAFFSSTSGANIRVLNNSWGGGPFSTALRSAIINANSSNMLFVAAAGNGGFDGIGDDNDLSPFYPASYDVSNVVAVASTTNRDVLSGFSNFGATSVDLAAPGSNILSTDIGGDYGYKSGTSMATPHVAGAAALLLSECTLTTAALKDALLNTVDALPLLAGRVATGGRLNVDRAIRSCGAPTPPPAPTGLIAAAGNREVALFWNAAAGASSYRVKRSTVSGGPYSTIATGVIGTAYTDTGVTPGVTYFYVVSSVNVVGESANSAQAFATPFELAPLAPTGLKATPGDSRVELTWNPSAGATSYNVKRGPKTGPFVTIASTTSTTHIDLTVVNGTKYFYVVTALNTIGESGNSAKVSAVPGSIPPTPTGVSAATGALTGQINISWNPSAGATKYTVKRSKVSGGAYTAVSKPTGTSFTDSGLVSGTRYYYVVLALNANGKSAPSAEVSAIAR